MTDGFPPPPPPGAKRASTCVWSLIRKQHDLGSDLVQESVSVKSDVGIILHSYLDVRWKHVTYSIKNLA
jgi:hypothetical protein